VERIKRCLRDRTDELEQSKRPPERVMLADLRPGELYRPRT
jgi:hypothetical protein